MCSDRPAPSPFISPDYLSELHGIKKDEAELFYLFCRSHTIRYKECYGNGSIMLQLWKNEKNNATKAVKELIK